MVEEPTIDAYSEEEQLAGFAAVSDGNLAMPFETTVLGVKVTVASIGQTSTGILANCVRGKHRQAIGVLDLRFQNHLRWALNGLPPTGTGSARCWEGPRQRQL